jgi:regulation of enolase protein 1 (concanavalin A-like superfamily)
MCFVIVGLLLGTAAVAPAQGLKGEYFKGTAAPWTPTGTPVLTRIENVNFNWGGAAPDASVGADTFTVRWTGGITAPVTGTYMFRTNSDDGVRVWLNNDLIIDSWVDQSATYHASAGIDLEAGTTYPIRVEYYENGGDAVCQLYWRYPDQAEVAVPASVLSTTMPPRVPYLIARRPTPADDAIGVLMPLLAWTPGETAIFEDVYLGTTPDLTSADLVSNHQMAIIKMWYHVLWPLVPGNTYYWRIDAIDAAGKVFPGEVWSFTMAPVAAFSPLPPDGAMYQSLDADLSWTPGQNAKTHQLWFGTNKDDVTNGAASVDKGVLATPQFTLPPLTLNTTYYWRVDETDMSDVVRPGQVWSFTTTVAGLGFAKCELWMNSNSGTTIADIYADSRYPGSPTDVNDKMPNFLANVNIGDNYIGRLSAWLHVPASGKYTFWVCSDDQGELYLGADPDSAVVICRVDSWTNSEEWDKVGEQKSQPIQLEAGRYYLMAQWKEGGGGDDCGAAWQGPGIPTRELISGNYLMPFEAVWAYGPRPRNGEPNAPQSGELKWTSGTRAAKHQIYFSEDRDAVADGEPGGPAYRGEQAADETSFSAGQLAFNTTYYWRVDEVNPAEADSPWKGTVWSFATADFIVVDNFESYTNDSPNRVFQTWIDGWGFSEDDFFPNGDPGNGTSASVGHDIWATGTPYTTIIETSIVNAGGSRQSMPFDYNNINSPYYSQTDRTWTSGQNWTLNSSDALSLWFHGFPPKFIDTGTKITLSGAGSDIYGGVDEFRFAYKKLTGDGSISVKVDNVQTVNAWTKTGVMIRESLDPLAMQVHMINAAQQQLVEWMYRAISGDTTTTEFNTAVGTNPSPVWVRLTRAGNVFTGEYSANGTTWTKITQADGTASTITLSMPSTVYIGMVVCSHVAGSSAVADFSDLKVSGSVTGAWQTVDMTLAQPGNDPDQLYVILQDSTGKSFTVNHPDGVNAVLKNAWTEWKIPLNQFTGVNPAKIKKMSIGVGNPKSPKADGHGLLYFDDIRVVKPTP